MINLVVTKCSESKHLIEKEDFTYCLCGKYRKVLEGPTAWRIEERGPNGWVPVPKGLIHITYQGFTSHPVPQESGKLMKYILWGTPTGDEMYNRYNGHPGARMIGESTDKALIDQLLLSSAARGAWMQMYIEAREEDTKE